MGIHNSRIHQSYHSQTSKHAFEEEEDDDDEDEEICSFGAASIKETDVNIVHKNKICFKFFTI